MEFLLTYTPDIEQVSVDECYMDFTGIASHFHSPVDAALEIKNAVYEKFGFTVNIGISSNKLFVDECYMDFTGIASHFHSPVDAALEIKNAVYEKFGFTVNIGISSNKLLAKMASDFEKPNKVHTLFPQEIQVKMWPLPVSELYMAGKSSVQVLKKLPARDSGKNVAASGFGIIYGREIQCSSVEKTRDSDDW